MPDLPDTPYYNDGQAAVTDYSLEILNIAGTGGDTYQRLLYVGDDIGGRAAHTMQVDPDTIKIGSTTYETHRAGTIRAQLNTVADTMPRPGYIVRFKSRLYVINGDVSPGREKNKEIPVSLPVEECTHPVIPALLSSLGQRLNVAAVESVAITAISCAALSNRTGGTLAYAVDTTKGAGALPTGLSINASTGEITGDADAGESSLGPNSDGVFPVYITATETLTGYKTRVGEGLVVFTITS